MTSLASLKAFLFDTRGSSNGKERRQLNYQLLGHPATLAPRESSPTKGKFSLSIGKKIDLSKDSTSAEVKEKPRKKSNPVIVPECREDTDLTDYEQKDLSCSPMPVFMREDTNDVPLTDDLLKNNTSKPTVCTECANVGLYTKLYKLRQIENHDNGGLSPCFICEKRRNIQRKKAKPEKELLMSIVYPHDFYDRYQSVRRSLNTPTDDGERRRDRKKKSTSHQKTVQPKTISNFTLPETITDKDKIILKPHVVKFKDKNKHTLDPEEVDVKNNEIERSVISKPVQSHTLPPLQPNTTPMKPKHLRCQPIPKAYFMAAVSSKKFLGDSQYSYFDQRGPFRGVLVSKSEKFERPKLSEIKHCKYNRIAIATIFCKNLFSTVKWVSKCNDCNHKLIKYKSI